MQRYDINDHIYYNIEVRNRSETFGDIPAQFKSTFQRFLVGDADEYNLAIPRFSIPRYTLPYSIFRVEEGLGQTDINLGIYTIRMSLWAGGPLYSEQLVFSPFSINGTDIPKPPSENNGVQDTSGKYYYVYTPDYWCDLYNAAFKAAFTALKTANPGISTTYAPYIRYNPTTYLYTLYVERHFVDEIKLEYNRPAFQTLGHIGYSKRDLQTIDGYYFMSLNRDNYLQEPLFLNGETPYGTVATNPPEWFSYQQEIELVSAYSSLKKFLFITNLIPVNPENTNVYDKGDELQSINIVTDFIVQQDRGDQANIVFNNSAPYRYIDLVNDNPIYAFDIYIYWVDELGEERLVQIGPQSVLEIKFAFVKKGLVS
jgi:hypothetical protein